MPDEWITVASFQSPLAAQIARGRLGDEGIEAISSGDLSATTFAGVSALGGPVQLSVRAEDVEGARAILADLEEHVEPGWEAEAEPESLWVCSVCGEAVPQEEPKCPSCQTPRQDITKDALALRRSRVLENPEGIERRDQVRTGPPVLSADDLREDSPELADPETFLADDLARRALRAGLIGFLFVPIAFYSLWLCLRLCLMPGELSAKNRNRLCGAILLNVLVMLAWGYFISGAFG
jgi:hypothetical protein